MAAQRIALITGASSGIGEATAVALAAHGFTVFGALEENSIDGAQAQLDTNLFGVMRMIKAVLPAMRLRGGGRIINVSSVVGQFAPAYVGLYATSKFALEGLTEARSSRRTRCPSMREGDRRHWSRRTPASSTGWRPPSWPR